MRPEGREVHRESFWRGVFDGPAVCCIIHKSAPFFSSVSCKRRTMRIGHPIEHRSKCHAFERILSAIQKEEARQKQRHREERWRSFEP